jgi:hypothetical protein
MLVLETILFQFSALKPALRHPQLILDCPQKNKRTYHKFPGLWCIVVVAPNENKSASSSALTLDRALQPIEIKKNFYSKRIISTQCLYPYFSKKSIS